MNDEWITNKIRFSYDSLNIQRLLYPESLIGDKYIRISWNKVFHKIICLCLYLDNDHTKVFCGPFLSIDSILSINPFFSSIGCYDTVYKYTDYSQFSDYRLFHLPNDTLIDTEDNNVLFIGTNTRLEVPISNAKYRKKYLENFDIRYFSIGLAIIIYHSL